MNTARYVLLFRPKALEVRIDVAIRSLRMAWTLDHFETSSPPCPLMLSIQCTARCEAIEVS